MVMKTISPAIAVPKAGNSWPAPGKWTYEDYLRLPDDGRRYEIIEGVLYVTNAPSYAHQFTVSKILVAFSLFVDSNNLGVVLTAPFEIHLSGIARPVLPDIIFIAAAQQPDAQAKFFEGVPDLIVEVLSPNTFRVDQSTKLDAYERAGVGEYWLADPKTRSITTYVLPEDGREFILLGQFGPDETLHSECLSGLKLAVDGLFVPLSINQ